MACEHRATFKGIMEFYYHLQWSRKAPTKPWFSVGRKVPSYMSYIFLSVCKVQIMICLYDEAISESCTNSVSF